MRNESLGGDTQRPYTSRAMDSGVLACNYGGRVLNDTNVRRPLGRFKFEPCWNTARLEVLGRERASEGRNMIGYWPQTE